MKLVSTMGESGKKSATTVSKQGMHSDIRADTGRPQFVMATNPERDRLLLSGFEKEHIGR
ncbi:hypothetical protein ES707_12508 [subsurface metagenome]